MITPKPCPFCGGSAVVTREDHDQGTKWGRAVCDSCGAEGPEVRTGYDLKADAPWRDDAIEVWNERRADRP